MIENLHCLVAAFHRSPTPGAAFISPSAVSAAARVGNDAVSRRVAMRDEFNRALYGRGLAPVDRYESEKWITIGSKETSGGERKGGFPVKITADGKIVAGGPPSLRGKPVSEAGEHLKTLRKPGGAGGEPSPSPRRAAADDDAETRRAHDQFETVNDSRGDSWEDSTRKPGKFPSGRLGDAIRQTAAEWEVDPAELAEVAESLWAEKRDGILEYEKAKQGAREITGLTRGRITAWEDAGHDYSTWPSLDTTALEVASNHPELGLGKLTESAGYDSTDYAAKVWAILREGKREPPPRHDAKLLREAAQSLHGMKRAERAGLESVPFSRRRRRALDRAYLVQRFAKAFCMVGL